MAFYVSLSFYSRISAWQLANFALAFQHYTVIPTLDNIRILQNEEKLPWSAYVGVAGMPGML